MSEIDEAGALLVRPDGYMAWRKSAAVWDEDECYRLLRDALSEVLGKPIDAHDAPTEFRYSLGNYSVT